MEIYLILDDLEPFVGRKSKKLICTPDTSASGDTRCASMSRCDDLSSFNNSPIAASGPSVKLTPRAVKTNPNLFLFQRASVAGV
jgi:hypothetical protein